MPKTMDDDKIDKLNDGKLEIIKNHVKAMLPYFDTVQVFCTKYHEEETGYTSHFSHGTGNYLARYGQVKEWIVKEEKEMGNEE